MNADEYVAVIAGAETAGDACDRLNAAGHQATVHDESLVVDDGQATITAYEGTNLTNDQFYLWCIYDQNGELQRCAARTATGSCPPRG
jgi:hypothetical protein